MEQWEDQGLVLAVRAHGENGAVVSLLTEEHGRHAGYVRGATSSRNRGTLELGNLVDARWQSRVADNLGSFALELAQNASAGFMQDSLRLGALQSACALCDAALPEREGHAGLFHGLRALMEALEGDIWAPAYIMWEIALLREMGFSLDVSRCAGGGDADTLAYVSPKTGRAVSREAGEPYKDKLLPLPDFLKPDGSDCGPQEILTGLDLTAYFLEHWAFAHHTQGMPQARLLFQERFRNLT